jgi:hypothetical protein
MDHDWKYSVLLIRQLHSKDLAFFRTLSGSTVGERESFCPHFYCTEVDASHPIYLEITTFKPNEAGLRRLRIPHHFVFFISDPIDSEKHIGFQPQVISSLPP